MPPLPVLSAQQVAKALRSLGFTLLSQKGSHAKFIRGSYTAIVPMHRGDLKTGTLASIIKQAGITAQELRDNC